MTPQENLRLYELQLRAVEAQLARDPTNDKLLKAKTAVVDMITLTQELSEVKGEVAATPSSAADSASAVATASGLHNYRAGESIVGGQGPRGSMDGHTYPDAQVATRPAGDGSLWVVANGAHASVLVALAACVAVGILLHRRRLRSRMLLLLLTLEVVAVLLPIAVPITVMLLTALAYLWSIDLEIADARGRAPPALEPTASTAVAQQQSAGSAGTSGHACGSPPGQPRRHSSPKPTVPPERLATPVLQARLREALGSGVALPVQKPALVALFKQHCSSS